MLGEKLLEQVVKAAILAAATELAKGVVNAIQEAVEN